MKIQIKINSRNYNLKMDEARRVWKELNEIFANPVQTSTAWVYPQTIIDTGNPSTKFDAEIHLEDLPQFTFTESE